MCEFCGFDEPDPEEYARMEEYYKREQEWEEERRRALDELSTRCPVCGQNCGEADFDPPDPSVGIFSGVYVNYCEQDGAFYTYDDGTQEVEG